MSFNLVLNAKNVIGPNNNSFQYNFLQGSFTIPEGSLMGVSQITMPYSMINVSSALGNNTFQYYIPTGSGGTQTAFTVLLPNGFYTLTDIQNQLWATMKSNGHYFYNTLGPYSQFSPSPTIMYPLALNPNIHLYTNQITSYTIPTSTNIIATFGASYVQASSWSGGYPSGAYTGTSCPYLVIPTTNASTTTIGNILGFTGGSFPSTNTGLSGTTLISLANGNSLTTSPPFSALGSNVNGVIVRCNLVENNVQYPNDVLDSFPITSTYGSNINYLPISDNMIKLKAGKFSNLTITLNDQNFNPLICLDNNVMISILIKFPDKK